MPQLKTAILLFLIFFANIFPQSESSSEKQILIAKTYTEFGEPVDLIRNNQVDAGQTCGIILNNNRRDFSELIVFLNIEKQGNTRASGRFVKLLRTEKGKPWVALYYTFMEPGVYDVYFTDFARKKIAETTLIVKPQINNTNIKASVGQARPSLKIIFCEKMIGGNPIDHITTASLSKNNGLVYVYVSDGKRLDTEKLLVNIWMKTKTEYDKFVDSKKFKVNDSWRDTYFKYRFETPGDYKINFFDEKELLLKTAYITVEN